MIRVGRGDKRGPFTASRQLINLPETPGSLILLSVVPTSISSGPPRMAFPPFADLQGRRPGFSEQVPGNTPNVYFFQTRDPATATWFSELSGRQLGQSQTATVKAVEGELTETGAGSARLDERPRISRDLGYNLRKGQLYFLPESSIRPMLLAGAFMPEPSDDPRRRYAREVFNSQVEVSGLQLNYVISADQRSYAAEQQAARN
jgi:hypothetical protein